MLIIGFLLILAAAAVITYVLLATAGMAAVEVSYGVLNVEILPLWLFLGGVLTLALAAIGIWMVAAGARTKTRKAREVRELRKQAKEADRRAGRASDASTLGQRPGAPGHAGAPGSADASTGHRTTPERNRLEPDR